MTVGVGRPFAVASCTLGVVFLGWRIMTNPDVINDLNALPANVSPRHAYDRALDPPIGSTFKQLQIVRESTLAETKPMLVVVAGTCSSCSLRAFDPNTLDLSYYSHVFLVYFSSKDQLDPAVARLARKMEIFCDPKAVLSVQLNVAWWPRFYLLSNAGKLLDIQSNPAATPSFVHKKMGVR